MSDKELIIKSLQKADRRLRLNRLLDELTWGLSILLSVPLLFKAWDLFRPFRGRTVVIFLTAWLIAVIAYAVWRISQKTSLGHIAAAVDHKASLKDEVKSAYWFVMNPQALRRSGDWVELQIRRAAQRVSSMNVETLFPRVIPRTFYIAAGLFLLFIVLNFIPLTTNHNWVYLDAAPAFSLTADEQKLISETKKLLQQAQKLDQSQLAGKLEQIMQDLEQGKIDTAEAMKQLEDLKNTLAEGNLDTANINEGLDEMSGELGQSGEAKDVAEAMSSHDLEATADELKKLAEDVLKQDDQSAQKALQDALQQASETSNPAMQNMAQDMKNASEALAKGDQKGAQDALNKASQDAQQLQERMQEQQAKNSASQEIQNLQDSLRQRQEQQQSGQSAQTAQGKGQAQQNARGAQQQEKGGKSEGDAGEADPEGGSGPGTPTEQSSESGKEGQTQGQQGDQAQAGAAGKGQNPSGAGNAPMDIMGAPTKLNVKLEQEKLTAENDGGTPQNIEEASKQERSKLDYRNVHSDLSPAQKDVLNQDKIPWELKGLIKNYFEAIRPPHGKP
jgi:hypothetical protein